MAVTYLSYMDYKGLTALAAKKAICWKKNPTVYSIFQAVQLQINRAVLESVYICIPDESACRTLIRYTAPSPLSSGLWLTEDTVYIPW